MEIQIRALFTQDNELRLLFVNEPDGAKMSAPRLFLGRTRAGNVWRFHADLPEQIYYELDKLCADEPLVSVEFNEPPRHLEKYIALLKADAPIREISTGPAYVFTEQPAITKSLLTVTENDAEVLKGGFEELVEELPCWQPFVALVEETKAVSVCRSVRITPEAHEAGVETLPDFRGRGYAAKVTAEWARQVQAAGAVTLYSTSWKNTASQAVARKLGLKCFGSDFSVT